MKRKVTQSQHHMPSWPLLLLTFTLHPFLPQGLRFDSSCTMSFTELITRDVKRTTGHSPARCSISLWMSLMNSVTILMSFEQGWSIGPLWHATRTNGDVDVGSFANSIIIGTTHTSFVHKFSKGQRVNADVSYPPLRDGHRLYFYGISWEQFVFFTRSMQWLAVSPAWAGKMNQVVESSTPRESASSDWASSDQIEINE